MALPLITYAPTSQNQRVEGFEIPGDEQPRIFSLDINPDKSELDQIIQAAYRQIFNEQQMLASNRLTVLESQLKNGEITVKDFVRGLLTSPVFRERNYNANNNYRFVRMCVQRVLGREVYSDREVHAWSILLATQGLNGFVDALLNSEEYVRTFGENRVPFQRRRILPQREQGAITFAHTPRYGAEHLRQLKALGYDFSRTTVPSQFRWVPAGPGPTRWAWQQPPYSPVVQKLGAGITLFGAAFVGLLLIGTVLSWFGWIQI